MVRARIAGVCGMTGVLILCLVSILILLVVGVFDAD